jgi:hypothetical protein
MLALIIINSQKTINNRKARLVNQHNKTKYKQTKIQNSQLNNKNQNKSQQRSNNGKHDYYIELVNMC